MRACRFCRIVPALMMMALAFGMLSCELAAPFTITPPSWLIGRWSGYVMVDNEVWWFTENNIAWTTQGMSIDFVEYEKHDNVVMEQLTSTDDEYQIEVVEQGEVFVFRFVKSSPDILRYYISFTGVNAGPFILTKE